MAASEITTGRTTIGEGGLYTPQEPTLDSFSQLQDEDKREHAALLLPHSPPASPEFRPINGPHDSPLFDEPRREDEQRPLFDNDGDTHIIDAEPVKPLISSPATSPAKDYRNLARVTGLAHVFIENSRAGAWAYYQARMAELERIRAAQRAAGTLPFPSKSPATLPRDPETARQLRLVDQSARVTKTRSPPKAAARPRRIAEPTPSRATSPAVSEARPVSRRSRTPRARTHDVLTDENGERKHKRAAPSKQTATKEDDLRWRDIPNYAPALPEIEKPYGVSWKQSSRQDNSAEPDYDELSAAEKEACTILRLQPVRWLANKRRIFEAKLEAVRKGEKFTKTKAQVAGNIDVNKTTQMFDAFERMGWMDNAWFEQFGP